MSDTVHIPCCVSASTGKEYAEVTPDIARQIVALSEMGQHYHLIQPSRTRTALPVTDEGPVAADLRAKLAEAERLRDFHYGQAESCLRGETKAEAERDKALGLVKELERGHKQMVEDMANGADMATNIAACRMQGERDKALADLAAEREMNATLKDAYETLYDSIKEMPNDTDSDASVYRCLRRRFEEAVGERFTRLLKERPEGEKLYALAWQEIKQERDALRDKNTTVQADNLRLDEALKAAWAERDALKGLLRECQSADCNSQYPLKLDHARIDAVLVEK